MFLSNSFIKSRFSFMSYALRLSAISVMALTGATNLGWGSLEQAYHELDNSAVIKWQMTKFPEINDFDNEQYKAAGGSIHSQNHEFSILLRRIEGITKIRVLYHGENDHSLTPLSALKKAETIPAKDLGDVLGIDRHTFVNFMQKMGVDPSAPTFPSNIVEGYRWINSNSLVKRVVDSHHDIEESLWSITGGPVSALGAVKILIESWNYNQIQGKPVRFHLNVMGYLPEYSWDFLSSALRINKRLKSLAPTAEGKWFPVLKKTLEPWAIERFENAKRAVEKRKV